MFSWNSVSPKIKFINSDGANETQLTSSTNDEKDPKLSPDKSKIVFTTDRHGDKTEIYIINVNGSGETRLTSNSQYDTEPSWSPDGSKIVYVTYEEVASVSRYAIYTMNVDGSNKTRITPLEPTYNNVFNQPSLPYYFNPQWNPDGTKIVFVRYANQYKLFSVNPDGSGFNQTVAGNVCNVNCHAWSPNGNKLAYVSDELDPGEYDLWVINSDGSNKTRLTFNGSQFVGVSQLAWSPDGTEIAYRLYSGGSQNIATVILTDPVKQVRTHLGGSSPSWSPDGSKIAFSSKRNGNADIYIMNKNGSSETQLTTATSSVDENDIPSWIN